MGSVGSGKTTLLQALIKPDQALKLAAAAALKQSGGRLEASRKAAGQRLGRQSAQGPVTAVLQASGASEGTSTYIGSFHAKQFLAY